MIENKELQNCITRIRKDDNIKNNNPETVRYNSIGSNDSKAKKKLSDADVCAIYIDTVNPTYKIKTQRGGKLYNPLNANAGYGLDKRDRITGDQMFVFRQVNKRVFDNYIKFLQTKYDSYLIAAERELQ